MRQDGLLRGAKKPISHPQHVECSCPHCKPVKNWTVRLSNGTTRLLDKAPSLFSFFPHFFSVTLRDPETDERNSEGKRRSLRSLGYFVAMADLLPIVESENVRVVGFEEEGGAA
jgi:hypothetical protein